MVSCPSLAVFGGGLFLILDPLVNDLALQPLPATDFKNRELSVLSEPVDSVLGDHEILIYPSPNFFQAQLSTGPQVLIAASTVGLATAELAAPQRATEPLAVALPPGKMGASRCGRKILLRASACPARP